MRDADESHTHNEKKRKKETMDLVALARKMQRCAIKAADLCKLIKVAVQ